MADVLTLVAVGDAEIPTGAGLDETPSRIHAGVGEGVFLIWAGFRVEFLIGGDLNEAATNQV